MDKAQAKTQATGNVEEDEHMNTAMIIELIIIVVLASVCVISHVLLRKKLREYDGMGQVKKEVAHRKRPSDKRL